MFRFPLVDELRLGFVLSSGVTTFCLQRFQSTGGSDVPGPTLRTLLAFLFFSLCYFSSFRAFLWTGFKGFHPSPVVVSLPFWWLVLWVQDAFLTRQNLMEICISAASRSYVDRRKLRFRLFPLIVSCVIDGNDTRVRFTHFTQSVGVWVSPRLPLAGPVLSRSQSFHLR